MTASIGLFDVMALAIIIATWGLFIGIAANMDNPEDAGWGVFFSTTWLIILIVALVFGGLLA